MWETLPQNRHAGGYSALLSIAERLCGRTPTPDEREHMNAMKAAHVAAAFGADPDTVPPPETRSNRSASDRKRDLWSLRELLENPENLSFRKLMLPEPKAVAQYISPESLAQLIEDMPDFAALAVRFLYLSGARVRDALRLEWGNIDLESGWIRFYVAKTDEHREQPIIGPMRELLDEIQAHRAEVAKRTGRLTERVFVTDQGRALTYSRLRQPWEKARGDTGLRMHDLRASCVTNLANAGVPSLQAKEWTGHAGLGVHDRYLVVSRAVAGRSRRAILRAAYSFSRAAAEQALGGVAERLMHRS